MSATRKNRPSAGARRVGYAVAALVNAILLYLINGRPGWAAVPFLTQETTTVLALVNTSLIAGIVVNLAFLPVDPPWLVAAGSVVTTGLGLAVLVRLWQVFPVDLSAGWNRTSRVLLAFLIAATVVGLLVQAITALREIIGHRVPGSARHSS